MPKPHFSELLQRRRHELGLSIEQASRILKLREDVLVSFEEGDFERIPQSGYAQGMLSSYARYLGLNSREITDLFQEELYHYVHGTSSHELRRRTRDTQTGRFIAGYDVVNAEGSRPKAYVEYRGLLPTSGGPAGDMGAFASVSDARPRRTMPMAGSGPSAASAYGRGGYGQGQQAHSYNASAQGASSQDDEAYRSSARRARNQRRRSTNNNDPASRLLSQRQQVTGAASTQMTRQYSGSRANSGRTGGSRPQRAYRRDDVSTRRVVSGDYSDDMRYDDRARPYERASTISGRRSSRNIASVDRPNVRRRAPKGGYGPGTGSRNQRGRRQPAKKQGLLGGVLGFFADSRNATFAIIVLLAMVLTGILVFAATSCVNAKTGSTSSQAGQTVSVSSTDTSSSKNSGSGSSSSSDSDSSSSSKSTTTDSSKTTVSDSNAADATTDAADGAATDATATTTQQATVVKVSVADGEYSWLEITCDGTSAVAESVTGPWEQEYTVTDSITIRAANPSKVSVTENGKKVDFTSKASGTGTLTIKGTPVTTTDETAADGTDAAATTGTTSTTTATTSTTTATTSTSTAQ